MFEPQMLLRGTSRQVSRKKVGEKWVRSKKRQARSKNPKESQDTGKTAQHEKSAGQKRRAG
jgi:hypothetical protein